MRILHEDMKIVPSQHWDGVYALTSVYPNGGTCTLAWLTMEDVIHLHASIEVEARWVVALGESIQRFADRG